MREYNREKNLPKSKISSTLSHESNRIPALWHDPNIFSRSHEFLYLYNNYKYRWFFLKFTRKNLAFSQTRIWPKIRSLVRRKWLDHNQPITSAFTSWPSVPHVDPSINFLFFGCGFWRYENSPFIIEVLPCFFGVALSPVFEDLALLGRNHNLGLSHHSSICVSIASLMNLPIPIWGPAPRIRQGRTHRTTSRTTSLRW